MDASVLKGRHNTAQDAILGIAKLLSGALKGRDSSVKKRRSVPHFQCFTACRLSPRVALVPRLPWALLSLPFRTGCLGSGVHSPHGDQSGVFAIEPASKP